MEQHSEALEVLISGKLIIGKSKSDAPHSPSHTCCLAEPRALPRWRALHAECYCSPRRPPLLHANEPASTRSKSSDDTDAARLIFTLDSPSSPLHRRVYLPAQLGAGEDGEAMSRERVERVEFSAATTLASIVYEDGRCLSSVPWRCLPLSQGHYWLI